MEIRGILSLKSSGTLVHDHMPSLLGGQLSAVAGSLLVHAPNNFFTAAVVATWTHMPATRTLFFEFNFWWYSGKHVE